MLEKETERLKLMKAGNVRAIESFWEEHKRYLFHIAAKSINRVYGKTIDPAVDPESFAGEVFAIILKDKKFPETEKGFIAFFITVSSRRMIDQRRELAGRQSGGKGERWEPTQSIYIENEEGKRSIVFSKSMDRRTIRRAREREQIGPDIEMLIPQINSIIDSISDPRITTNFKETLRLRLTESLSKKKIANRLGLKEGSIDTIISLTKTAFIDEFEKRQETMDPIIREIINGVLGKGMKFESLVALRDSGARDFM